MAAIVDRACADASSYVEIGGRLNNAARSPAGDDALTSPLGPFVSAFSYDLAELNSERRDTYGPFVPMFETATHSFPLPVDAVGAEDTAAWAEVHGLVREPAARARLGDLLWLKKGDRPPWPVRPRRRHGLPRGRREMDGSRRWRRAHALARAGAAAKRQW